MTRNSWPRTNWQLNWSLHHKTSSFHCARNHCMVATVSTRLGDRTSTTMVGRVSACENHFDVPKLFKTNLVRHFFLLYISWDLISLCVFCLSLLLNSKQNQLWAEGAEFYKGKPFGKAEPHEYGIYSIKQRELKSTNGNGLQTSTTITKGNCAFQGLLHQMFTLFFFIFYPHHVLCSHCIIIFDLCSRM